VLILVSWSLNSDYDLRLSFGIIGSYVISSKAKYKYKDPQGKELKEITRGHFNLNPVRFDLSANIYILEEINISINYGLMPLFVRNRGPELTPFTIGISYTPINAVWHNKKGTNILRFKKIKFGL